MRFSNDPSSRTDNRVRFTRRSSTRPRTYTTRSDVEFGQLVGDPGRTMQIGQHSTSSTTEETTGPFSMPAPGRIDLMRAWPTSPIHPIPTSRPPAAHTRVLGAPVVASESGGVATIAEPRYRAGLPRRLPVPLPRRNALLRPRNPTARRPTHPEPLHPQQTGHSLLTPLTAHLFLLSEAIRQYWRKALYSSCDRILRTL